MPPTSASPVISNWHTLHEDFSTSTQDFYRAIEIAIVQRGLPGVILSRVLWSEGGIGSSKREYLRVQRKNVAFDICSAPYGNGHFFSWWLVRVPPRFGVFSVLGIFFLATFVTWILYLMLSPFVPDAFIIGSIVRAILALFLYPVALLLMGFLVQEGLLGDEERVMSLPVIGRLYVFAFNPLTYYRLDTAMMFRDSVRSVVNEVIAEQRDEKGLRLLADEELRQEADGERATA